MRTLRLKEQSLLPTYINSEIIAINISNWKIWSVVEEWYWLLNPVAVFASHYESHLSYVCSKMSGLHGYSSP